MTRTVPLLPDSQDITAHLQWLFGETEGAHESALIEIAYDEPGKGSPSRARLFCAPELSEAVSFATETNRRGCNVWVGAALKKPGTPRGKRTKADNFLVAFAIPIDIDENAASVNAKLDQIAVAGLTVTTGTIPELRQQKWFRLAQPCADPAPYEAAIKRIVEHVGADASATGAARLMRLGGTVSYAAMLHDFLSRDISAFKVTEIPASEALNAQKRESLNTEQRWWMTCLSRGYVLRSKLGLEAELHQWLETASTELLYESYETFAKATHERHPLNRVAFGKFMKEVGASSTRLRDAIVGERMVHRQGEHYSETHNAPRPTGYYLGDIAHARGGFEELLGHLIEWPDAEGASAANTLFEDFL